MPLFGLVFLLAIAPGCYAPSISRVINEPAPIPESLRTNFGRIALLPDPVARGFQMRHPPNTGEAMSRAITHAAGKAEDLDDFAGLAFVGLGVVGVVESLFTGIPQYQIDADAEELKRALHETPLLPGVVERLQSGLGARGREPWPSIPKELAEPLLAQPPAARDYRTLASCGCDSVLELAVYRQAFRAERRNNPPMSFEASVHVYVTRVSDGALLFVQPFDYRTRRYFFGEWADHKARRFRAELQALRVDAARAILEQLFGGNRE